MSPIHYIHLRQRDIFGEPLAKGGITVAYRHVPEEGDVPACAEFGFAFCSPKDAYVKAKGRMLAVEAMGARPFRLEVGELPYAQMEDIAWLALNSGVTAMPRRIKRILPFFA